MIRMTSGFVMAMFTTAMVFCAQAQNKPAAAPAAKPVVNKAEEAPVAAKPAVKKTEAAPAKAASAAAVTAKSKAGPADTLVIKARLVEVPGTFPPNDLYNYVYVMKYRVLEVVKGTYGEQEILVGHYNPLIPRKQINDKMDKFVDGDVTKFEEGSKHILTVITPIDKVWKEAKEDEYFDVDDAQKFYALKADMLK